LYCFIGANDPAGRISLTSSGTIYSSTEQKAFVNDQRPFDESEFPPHHNLTQTRRVWPTLITCYQEPSLITELIQQPTNPNSVIVLRLIAQRSTRNKI